MSASCSGNCDSCGESCSDRKPESLLAEPNKKSNVKKVIDGRFQLFLLFLHGIAADLRHEHAARKGKADENQHGKAHIVLDKKVFHQSLVSNL